VHVVLGLNGGLGFHRSPGRGELEGDVEGLRDEDCGAAHDVGGVEPAIPVDYDLNRLAVVTGHGKAEAVFGADRVGGGPLDRGCHRKDPQGERRAETFQQFKLLPAR
jgi:hypothetical protein